MESNEEFGHGYASTQISRSKSPVRRFIKQFYVSRVVRRVTGRAIDLGCGAGQILSRLPPGSLGIEINPHLVEMLQSQGLRVVAAANSDVGFDLSAISKGEFETLVLSHVLEHCHQADLVLRKLLEDCSRMEITKVIIVVPTIAGYRSDVTHKTHIDLNFIKAHSLENFANFQLAEVSYFPWNSTMFESLFTYHEMMLVFDAKPPLQ